MENQELKDTMLVCKDCGNEFIWSAGEIQFYTDKGFETPKRCSDCRKIRKQQKRDAMKNSN